MLWSSPDILTYIISAFELKWKTQACVALQMAGWLLDLGWQILKKKNSDKFLYTGP
jgi:hypothetical protein